MPDAILSTLAGLEQRYNGPIPDGLRLAAQLGSAEAVELVFAAGQAAFYRTMVRRQIEIIRQRRADGSFYSPLIADLHVYRAAWRRWHRARRAAAGEV